MTDGLTITIHKDIISSWDDVVIHDWYPLDTWSWDTAIDKIHDLVRNYEAYGELIEAWVIDDVSGEVIYHFCNTYDYDAREA